MQTWLKGKIIKVLIVEDDEDDFVLTKSLLKEIHPDKFEEHWAQTYEDGLSKLSADEFDVCLLDYRLGSRNGVEFIREAKDLGYAAPIILLTGQSDQELDFEAMRAGAADYLEKSQINAANFERSIRYSIQQKQMEDERVQRVRDQEARIHAEAANQAKDDFLAMVSHELRTPLNAMVGWVGLLRANKDSEEVFVRAVEAIDRSAKAQTRLLNDLLDISRIVSGNLLIEKQPVHVASVLEPIIEAAFPSAEQKKIELRSDLDRSAKWINGDPHRLQQVVNNLLQNAVKFTPEGGRILVSLEYQGNSAKITVLDTGRGISSDFLPFVFERYRQATGPQRRAGLGLGLAIARYIVEMHGGSIVASSDGEGHGAIFEVMLPVGDAISESLKIESK